MYRYATELKDSETPTHILLLQAQVCRAVHHLCVDTAQLQMLKRTKETIVLLAQGQEGEQLNRVLWAVEAKVELQQQAESNGEEDLNNVECVTNGKDKEESGRVTSDVVDSLLGLKAEDAIELSDLTQDADKAKHYDMKNVYPMKANTGSDEEHKFVSATATTIRADHFSSEKMYQSLNLSDGAVNVPGIDEHVYSFQTTKKEPSLQVAIVSNNSPFKDVSTWNCPKSKCDEDDDWQEIAVDEIKTSNLDALLDGEEKEAEQFHMSLPTTLESSSTVNERGIMVPK
jgi:hypothetical protein